MALLGKDNNEFFNLNIRPNIGVTLVKARGGNDIIIGAANDENLQGQEGDDIIVGGAGSDVIDGGNGNDELDGEEGDDVILGDRRQNELLLEESSGGKELHQPAQTRRIVVACRADEIPHRRIVVERITQNVLDRLSR